MGEMADLFQEWREHKRAKRASNTEQSVQALEDAGVSFVYLNGRTHLLVVAADKTVIDFWPSTGLWMERNTGVRHRGVFRLISRCGTQRKDNT
jgi:hypothetical protein